MPITVGVFRDVVRSKGIGLSISGNITSIINRTIPTTSSSFSKEKRSSATSSVTSVSQESLDLNDDDERRMRLLRKNSQPKSVLDRESLGISDQDDTYCYDEPPSPPAPPPGGLFEAASINVQSKMSELMQISCQVATSSADTECRAYVSKSSRQLDRLVVYIGDSDGSPGGLWSAKLCTRSGSEGGGIYNGSLGSMLPYISKARKENYGVIIYDDIFKGCIQKNKIDMDRVVSRFITGWRNFVATSNATHIFLVVYRDGGKLLVEALRKHQQEVERFISGIAFIDSTHEIGTRGPYVLRRLMAQWSISFITSRSPLLTRLHADEDRVGSVCFSIGKEFADVEALKAVMESVYASFKARWSGFRVKTANGGMERLCFICQNNFNMRRWRRHCRTCQNACCEKCSSVEQMQLEGQVRLCLVCRALPSLIQWSRPRAVRTGEKSSVLGECTNPGKLSVTDFELITIIGSGACGKVILVQKKAGHDAGRLFAMKVLKKNWVMDKDLVTQTMAERRILQEANHPYIVQLQYAFQNRDKLYMVMDYYSGGSLRHALRRRGRFSIRRTQIYLGQIFLAISHLHSLGIMYRDLKLENVVIAADGNVACTDFGLSKEEMDDQGRASSFVGTCEYLAPELILKEGYGKAVDWWAFGVLAYEMIQGDSPFRHRSPAVLFEKILGDEPVFSDRFPSEAADLIANLLQKDPQQRLGCGAKGVDEIKTHAFFADIDWDDLLERRMKIPRPPHRLEDVTDESNLNRAIAKLREEREEMMPDSPVSLPRSPTERMHFDRFSYAGEETWDPSMASMRFDENLGDFVPSTIGEDDAIIEDEAEGDYDQQDRRSEHKDQKGEYQCKEGDDAEDERTGDCEVDSSNGNELTGVDSTKFNSVKDEKHADDADECDSVGEFDSEDEYRKIVADLGTGTEINSYTIKSADFEENAMMVSVMSPGSPQSPRSLVESLNVAEESNVLKITGDEDCGYQTQYYF
uniref:Ribosomal protein S6 kinase putative n=1 Tax=Albugo laibachii Nc14 TaxID=890382 RepID=F0WN57_9STRA|nr:ribosomal protein S6 kinase putative [Albugo laibachii Nc14]|eukprot:CCA22746.1 ribosomal protein S6 kinase putative [Albugo laibachii Nc14]